MIRKGSGKSVASSAPYHSTRGDLGAAERLANYSSGADPLASPPVTSPDSDPGMATGIGSPGSDMADITSGMDSLSTSATGHRDSTFSMKDYKVCVTFSLFYQYPKLWDYFFL